ncbi:MAG: S4 domain-containing protein, partial [Brasilonema sp.]
MNKFYLKVKQNGDGFANTSGDRLDRYLSQELPNLSRSRIQQLIEQSHVQLNGNVCISKKIAVKAGDRISIEIPNAEPLELQPEDIPLEILYEDDSLLIINKTAGLVVHPAPGHQHGTLVNAILAHCPNLPGIGGVQR